MHLFIVGALASLGVLSVAGMARADDPKGGSPADVAAIKDSARLFVEAFNRGDAKAIAAGWTDNGELYDDSGTMLIGRDAIEKAYAKLFQDRPKNKITIDVQSVRFLAPGCAIEEGTSRLESPGAELPTSGRYSAFHLRENGAWKIAYAREWGGASDKLEDLGWLVGTWSARGKDRDVRVTFAWNDAKTFLENRFSVSEGGRITTGGVQEIGRDARTGQLCSWVFADDGGRGQTRWVRDGNRWLMESVGMAPNGAPTTATNILTRVNDNEFSWRSVNRRMDGQPVPDAAPITVSRVGAK